MKILNIIFRVLKAISSRIRIQYFRVMGVVIIGRNWLGYISIPRNWGDITIEGSSLDDGVVLLCSGTSKTRKIMIEKGTYINRYTMIDAHESISIGPECMIGPHCYITDGDHGMEVNIPVGKQAMITAPVVLEEGVWLGAGVKVLKGVTIGRNAVVGAGAVVTKNIPPNAIAVGIPAKEIGYKS